MGKIIAIKETRAMKEYKNYTSTGPRNMKH